MHPLMDPEKYTDEEIVAKLAKCHQYLAYQIGLGHDAAAQSIQAVIVTLELEKEKRFVKRTQAEDKSRNDAAKVPYSDIIEIGKIDENKGDFYEDW